MTRYGIPHGRLYKYMMKLKDMLPLLTNEDYAFSYGMPPEPQFDPKYAKVIGTFDGKDVWGSRFIPDHHVIAFRTNEILDAYIIVEDTLVHGAHPIVRVWSRGGKERSGYITALILFLLRKLHVKLLIKSDEALTPEGWNLLVRSIQRGRFTAKDAATGKTVDKEHLNQDRILQQTVRTPLSLILESYKSKYPLFGTGYRNVWEKVEVIGDETLP